MNTIILLLGPTIMIFIGLNLAGDITLTFSLFYGWLFLVPFLNRKISAENKLATSKRNSAAAGVISGILCILLIFGSCSLFLNTFFDLDSLRDVLDEWDFSGRNAAWLVLILIFINPFLEEYYWRSYMMDKLRNKFGSGKAILITSAFYSLYHLLSLLPMMEWPYNFIAVLPVFAAGLLWGYFRHRYQSLIAPIISHILADFGIMLVYLIWIT
ncbi:CPBP family intramembrane glutamic endopeptidase [Falsibacillus pallidus]|uniref:CPBP family intramembrane glutamic endopeptidase n=1 Tax=Falsibacillus pallidus TaxID=493781 RepID=UPI003D980375